MKAYSSNGTVPTAASPKATAKPAVDDEWAWALDGNKGAGAGRCARRRAWRVARRQTGSHDGLLAYSMGTAAADFLKCHSRMRLWPPTRDCCAAAYGDVCGGLCAYPMENCGRRCPCVRCPRGYCGPSTEECGLWVRPMGNNSGRLFHVPLSDSSGVT
jgi:hypothetical protein